MYKRLGHLKCASLYMSYESNQKQLVYELGALHFKEMVFL